MADTMAVLADDIRALVLVVKKTEASTQALVEHYQQRNAELEGALQYILEEFRNGLRENKGGQHVPDHSPWANARRLPSLAGEMRRCVERYGKLVGVEADDGG